MAGGKVLIGGTAYDITKGKTMIGGTAYDITAGKTIVSGTAYDIKFNSSQATPKGFRDLIDDMTVVMDVSVNQQTATSSVYIPKASLPSSGTAYWLSCHNGALGIWRMDGSTVNSTAIMFGMNGGGGISTMSGNIAYANTYSSNSRPAVNGSSMILVRFPSFNPTDVENILANATYAKLAGRDGMSAASVYTSSQEYNYIMAVRYKSGTSTGYGENSTSLQFYSPTIETFSQISNKTPNWQGSSISSDIITLGSVFGGTIIGIDEPADSQMIRFWIDDIPYVAESGMTWGEWCASKYNTNNEFVNCGDGGIWWQEYGQGMVTQISPYFSPIDTTLIVSGGTYILE